MKQLLKKILPRPVIDAAIAARNSVQLATVPRMEFDAASLPLHGTLAPEKVFTDTKSTASWQADSSAIESLLPDKNRFDGVNPGDRRALYYLIRAFKPQKILEVGTHIGASTIHIAMALKANRDGGHVTSVDIIDVNAGNAPWKRAGLPASPLDMARRLGCGEHTSFIASDSIRFMEEIDQKFDFIFLDGDHSSRTVYREIAAALRLLNPNGMILLHDYYPAARPLFPNDTVITGPFQAIARIVRETQAVNVQPLSPLPWETKQGSGNTSLALLTKL